jgi:hypothetical protein
MASDISGILLSDELFSAADKFKLLKQVSQDKQNFRDNCILVAMRMREGQWGDCAEIATSLVRKSGLFLYLKDEQSSTKDLLTREFYRSPSGRDYFMHRAQFEVLERLLSGKSVILSAPTSFGKSFVIDELLISGKYKNVLIIVPTIALIDETRRRIHKLKTPHKITCFTGQPQGEENVYILTQERALEMQAKIGELDLLIIDEFYKMDSSLGSDDSDRAGLLNVCYKIYESKAEQTYLLGPSIQHVAGYVGTRGDFEVIVCEDNTTFIEYVHVKGKREDEVHKIIDQEESNILIYCNSPAEIAKLYQQIAARKYNYDGEKFNLDFADWIDQNVCPDWYVSDALKLGIGVHHARMPRFVAQEMIKRFNEGSIKVLLCTSTIIEGVNTNAKTVIVYSRLRGKTKMDAFTFKNIAGRAGRMFRHFSGKVYYFQPPDSTEDITVTDQIGNDEDGIEANMLNLLENDQLTKKQADKVSEHTSQASLPLGVIKENYFIKIADQENVYAKIIADGYPQLTSIRTSHPTQQEIGVILNALADLGLNFMQIGRAKTRPNGIIRTSIFINAFLSGGVKGVAMSVTEDRRLSDDNIEFAFDFIRNQLNFKLPRYIRALDRLLKVAGSYGTLEPFATTLEFLNEPPVYIQLDELGLPVQISKKLNLSKENLETALKQTKERNNNSLGEFESRVLDEFNED